MEPEHSEADVHSLLGTSLSSSNVMTSLLKGVPKKSLRVIEQRRKEALS